MNQKDPQNLEEIVTMLYQETEEYRKNNEVDETNIDKKLPHHGFGTSIRNGLNLWWSESLVEAVYEKDPNSDYPKEKPALVKWFNDRNIFHADDMSGTIQAALKAKVAGYEFDFDAHVKRYFKHWKELGFKDGIFKPEK
jgi:hypothetical protein